MRTIPYIPYAFHGGSMLLPSWTLEDAAGIPKLVADLTTLTYTLYRADDAATVGAVDRNGKNANGVTIDTAGRVSHLVPASDNDALETGVPERRRVVYTCTFSSGQIHIVTVEYWLRTPLV